MTTESERIESLAKALADGLNVEIDYDPGTARWRVEIDQGLGYTPRVITEHGNHCDMTLDAALGRAGV